MKGFIVLTRVSAGGELNVGLRLNIWQIVAYYPAAGGQSAVVTADGGDDWWVVAETSEEIDALIGGAS